MNALKGQQINRFVPLLGGRYALQQHRLLCSTELENLPQEGSECSRWSEQQTHSARAAQVRGCGLAQGNLYGPALALGSGCHLYRKLCQASSTFIKLESGCR